MSRPWRLLTHRGRFFVVVGIVVVLVAMAAGQRDVMRLGLVAGRPAGHRRHSGFPRPAADVV